MCIVETTTYNYSDGKTATKQYLKPCTESRDGKPCDFETYKDLGERYVREIRPESYSPTSPSLPSASSRRDHQGHDLSYRPNRQRDSRSHLARGADILLGTGRGKRGKSHKKKYHEEHQDDSQHLSAPAVDKFSRQSRRYSLSGHDLAATTSEKSRSPPASSRAGPSGNKTGRKTQIPLSPPRSPGSLNIQQSGTAVYYHPSSPSSLSHPTPTYRVITPPKAGKGFDYTEAKPEKTHKQKVVIVDNNRDRDDQGSRRNKYPAQHSSKSGKYVMSGALNFLQPGPSGLSTPPVTPERQDTEYQDRMAARENERAKVEAYNDELKKEILLDQHEEREQARYKHRENERRRKGEERKVQEQNERKRRSEASSGCWDYENEKGEAEETEALSEENRLRMKREGKRPAHRASPAASDPFPMGRSPSREPKPTRTSHHKYSRSVPIGQFRSDDLAATKEQMARERAATKARERQEALEDAARYGRDQARALQQAEKSAGYRLSPKTHRYLDTPTQSPTYRIDHMSNRRRPRRPSTADSYYDQLTAGSPSPMPASSGAPPSPYGTHQQSQGLSYPRVSYGQHSPHSPYSAIFSPSPHSPATYQDLQHQPYHNHFQSVPEIRRERGARVLAEAVAEEHRSRAEFGDRAGLSAGFRDLRLGGGAGYSGKYAYDDNYGARNASGGSGIRRRGTVSGDGRR